MAPHKKYLRAGDIAALTGASVRTVRRWIAEEVLPSTKLGGARLVAAVSLSAVLSAPHEPPEEASEEGEYCDAVPKS